MARLPLEGIRVTDFTQLVAGPYDTQLLAMMGAEVIKIESRRRPDAMRRATTGADGVAGLNRSGGFNAVNYAKKSCTLDLTKPTGVELAKEIIKLSDVVVENYGARTMTSFGLDYPVLKELKPDIIMLSNSVLGRKGPKGHYLGYFSGADAYSGTASLTGYLGGPPTFIGAAFSDWRAGTNGAFAILVALYHRSKTGEGQYID
ncbi:MAG: CoA transferase, partial [Chloroflexota bacterium]|nr:CoA transferase [Chloroflexota bacterium]